MQPVIRPASRDQIRCRAVRQRQSDRASDAIPKNGEQRTIQSDRLPTYLQSLTHLRPARPSKGSPGKVSDTGANPYLEASRSIFSSQCRQNRHQAFQPMQTLFSSKDILSRSLDTKCIGGAERDRTADPLLAKQVLSQLSYSPNHRNTRQQCRQDQESSSEPDGGPG